MKQIVIIGAGQIGSRHLQALAKLSIPVIISVVDPNLQSLKVAKERYKQEKENNLIKSIHFYQNLNELPSKIDFCIIATSANVRFAILKEIMNSKIIQYLLLEKVLFQSEEELEMANQLIIESNTKAWVNCNKRQFPVYLMIKELLSEGERINYFVEGHDWGLACNAIHFIDQLEWFSGDSILELDTRGLVKQVYQSKREGFLELYGTLCGRFKNGSEMRLTSRQNPNMPFSVRIETNSIRIRAFEQTGNLFVAKANENWLEKEFNLPTPYQSDLTQKIIEDVFLTGKCGLTGFLESCQQHQVFLNNLISYLKLTTGREYKRCPIT